MEIFEGRMYKKQQVFEMEPQADEKVIGIRKAVGQESISEEEASWLQNKNYNYLIVGETEIYASRAGKMFTHILTH